MITADQGGTTQQMASYLGCQASQVPITYLGLPLSDKKLPKSAYVLMIQREERRLS
jgi:hypothetical protein